MNKKYTLWDKQKRMFVVKVDQTDDKNKHLVFFTIHQDKALEFKTREIAKTLALRLIGKGKFEIKGIKKDVAAK